MEGGARQLRLLELFKGTGSIGKVAKKMGMSVMAIDILDKYEADVTADVLEWDYKKFFRDTGFIPDLLWASPPCNTYSPMVYRLHERDPKTARPLSKRAKEGTAILYRTLDIIKYCQKLNPDLIFCMENPKGMMRYDARIQKETNRDTTLYCLYGDKRVKPTDFFNNLPGGLDLEEPALSKCPKEGRVGVIHDSSFRGPYTQATRTKNETEDITKNVEERYFIPPKLVKHILKKMAAAYTQS